MVQLLASPRSVSLAAGDYTRRGQIRRTLTRFGSGAPVASTGVFARYDAWASCAALWQRLRIGVYS